MTSLATTRVASYARAVRDALSDLSPEHAHAVLDGLDDHLAEIVAEGAIDLDEVLGPPAVYAAELRASAGLAAAGGPRTDDRGSWGAPDTSLIAGPPDSPLASESSGSRASVRNAVPSSDDRAAEEPRTTDAAARQNNADRSALEQAGVRARRVWSHRGVNSARAKLVIVFGVLGIVVIRSSRPLNAFEIVLGALGICALWWLLRLTSRRAQLSEPWASRLPVALAVAAIIGAVLLGGLLAGQHVVYIGNTSSPTTGFRVGGDTAAPDVVGMTVSEASEMLRQFNLSLVVNGNERTLDSTMVILRMRPLSGTVVRYGSLITVEVAPVSSTLPRPSVVTPSPESVEVVRTTIGVTGTTVFTTVPTGPTAVASSDGTRPTTALGATSTAQPNPSTSTP